MVDKSLVGCVPHPSTAPAGTLVRCIHTSCDPGMLKPNYNTIYRVRGWRQERAHLLWLDELVNDSQRSMRGEEFGYLNANFVIVQEDDWDE